MKTKYIKQILMCKPLHYSVDYVINPWMQNGSINKSLALKQWESLVKTFKNRGIKVHIIDQIKGLPDMVFSTDQGITKNKKVLLSNFRYPQRRNETKQYKKWYEANDYTTFNLPEMYFFEGAGDSLLRGDTLFMGHGFRSTQKSTGIIASILNLNVVPLELIDPKFYHLDLALFLLDNDTAFYFPNAFSESSRVKLIKMIPRLYELTQEEALSFAANSVVTDHHVILQDHNTTFKNRLEELGYNVIEANVSEFLKAGGGIHCLVQILEEKYE